MRRFAPSQTDLFAPAAAPQALPARAPLAELADLLASLRGTERLPWPDAAAAMAEGEFAPPSAASVAAPATPGVIDPLEPSALRSPLPEFAHAKTRIAEARIDARPAKRPSEKLIMLF